jgi:hypothetical protein
VETLEFSTSPILVSLLCDLKNHVIVGSILHVWIFLIINLIEQGYLFVVGYPMIFYILRSTVTVRLGGTVEGVNYDNSEFHSRFGVAFNAIYKMHQPSINLKTNL